MGDIKSTLDLVMERTKHLSLSREERQGQQTAETRKRLAGLVQKWLDRQLKDEQFKKQLQQIKQNAGLEDDLMLHEAIKARLDLDLDLQPIIDLTQLCGINTAEGMKQLQQRFFIAVDRESQAIEQKIRSRLASGHRISGDAVVPNPDKDPAWQARRADIKVRFEQELQTL